MSSTRIVSEQLSFYRRAGAGCLFAARAAQDPAQFEWSISISEPVGSEITAIARAAIAHAGTSTQSVIFPAVQTSDQLVALLRTLQHAPDFTLELEQRFRTQVCLGFRLNFSGLKGWVTGFGPFGFLPRTRRAPYTELVFRTKPRPKYEWVLKETPDGVVHLADMDMKGMSDRKLRKMWIGSFKSTADRLGKEPDLRSAAKTTFAIPRSAWLSTDSKFGN